MGAGLDASLHAGVAAGYMRGKAAATAPGNGRSKSGQSAVGVFTFPVRKLNALPRRASQASRCDDEGRQAWQQLDDEPVKLPAAFPALRLRPGHALRRYRLREGSNGNAFVYAMSADAAVPALEECARNADHFLEPPVPANVIGRSAVVCAS